MKALNQPFTKIINGTVQFVIPVFQRDYSWTEAQCEQLWNDVLRIASEPTSRGHFIGAVVYVSTGDLSAGFTRWMLIDGQQRVTTLTLLLTAMRDYIIDSNWQGSEDGPTAKRIDAYFLQNVQEERERKYKLVLRRHDQATLRSLLDRAEPPNEASDRVRDNYQFFRQRVSQVDPETLYRGIARLIIVDVTLDRGLDDPQLIFESLNSTGMDLSQSDLIRNFILMRLPEKEQTRLYEKYWSMIENLFRGSEKTFDSFVRDYLALRMKVSKQERADAIYATFRRTFGDISSEPQTLEDLLKHLLRFARYHAAFSIGGDAPNELRVPLARLRHLVDVPATLVMRLFEIYDSQKTLSLEEFADAIGLVESYVFRRAICGEQTRGYWQIFAGLAYQIDPKKPFESLKVGFARLYDNARFPDDDEFRKALEERDLYHKRVCFDLLERLENYGNKEPTNTSKYSIEHIMPQNEKLDSAWREMLGREWREVQSTWLHRLGNLTLTGYNSIYSDRPFQEKQSIPDGFSESSVRLNKFVREQPQWTVTEMERRGKDLAKRALAIWPRLIADKKAIAAAQEAEMRERAKRSDVGKVPMTNIASDLFKRLHTAILKLDADIIELAEPRSISYHGPSFFLEVLPRTGGLLLILALDLNEVDDPEKIAKDTSEYAFIVNAVYDGGVYVLVKVAEDIEKTLPMIRQARDRAQT